MYYYYAHYKKFMYILKYIQKQEIKNNEKKKTETEVLIEEIEPSQEAMLWTTLETI